MKVSLEEMARKSDFHKENVLDSVIIKIPEKELNGFTFGDFKFVDLPGIEDLKYNEKLMTFF
jgi:hypothetical protein